MEYLSKKISSGLSESAPSPEPEARKKKKKPPDLRRTARLPPYPRQDSNLHSLKATSP